MNMISATLHGSEEYSDILNRENDDSNVVKW